MILTVFLNITVFVVAMKTLQLSVRLSIGSRQLTEEARQITLEGLPAYRVRGVGQEAECLPHTSHSPLPQHLIC